MILIRDMALLQHQPGDETICNDLKRF